MLPKMHQVLICSGRTGSCFKVCLLIFLVFYFFDSYCYNVNAESKFLKLDTARDFSFLPWELISKVGSSRFYYKNYKIKRI
ncbi:hypothetical protein MANES_11G006350v8 [Manihot esculenta]|uniref:Uncharacterized protein n=3 Tax=Manihot esculenta TaxID=3983 RepID=A0ACB7GT76_MANES|nr:hypothetical protein MANES_11G006350v8 [Manihot esculenta]KAG8643120.1 hypothetical protein MANES_11G006350v8 [Manihot esculenta]KAG8643121.1 hypothetical protein MANES_11G006350v8 [Manihot esculenta]